MKALLALFLLSSPGMPADSVEMFDIPVITIDRPLKSTGDYTAQPLTVTSLSLGKLEERRIAEPKNLSLTVPNFLHADYGSKMTSSIYIRGIGSRIDQPAVGLYVDNVPVLNKSNYDFDYFDVWNVDVLRGPQGTLHGRNTIGGLIDVHTLSPLDYQGTRLSAGVGNGGTWEMRASTYNRIGERFGVSVAASHRYSHGFFTNSYDDSRADRIISDGIRVKLQALLSDRWSVENTFYANYVDQNGFAYSPYDDQTGKTSPINHNDPCKYERKGLVDGLIFRYDGAKISFSSVTSYQFTDDDMTMDQDYSPRSLFTLFQGQRENAVTQEFVLRSAGDGRWKWISGVFGFYRHLDADAPVTLKREGIDEFILDNANKGIQQGMPGAELMIEQDELPLESLFKLPAYGLSVYHQSSVEVGRFTFTAGLRADYEHTEIKYDNSANLSYRLSPMMPQFKPVSVKLEGDKSKSFFELMPRFSVSFDTGAGNLYISAARGYKAGGFNTQMFSDVMQSRLMTAMMADMGRPAGEDGYDISSVISYKPEYSWNYELGGKFFLLDRKLQVDAALFFIDCRDQQLTVFPPGETTGRMMSNAGRTESYGAELSVGYRSGALALNAAYGYTRAKFVEYIDGDNDFSGNYVPYAPRNTVSLRADYTFGICQRWADDLILSLGWQGAGKIFWNEKNTVSQPFYGLLDASAMLKKNGFTFGLWAKNITSTDYHTFYFRSVGNSFVQKGKPLQFGVSVSVNL